MPASLRRTLWAPLLLALLPACAEVHGPSTSEPFLAHAWAVYKETFLAPEGYIWDPVHDGGEATSEGQSYALMRAAWMRDAEAFQRIYAWTEANLRRPDGLYAWRWRDGKVADWGTAADADQDIAFALILGAHHFQRPEYLERAKGLLQSIRNHESVTVGADWLPAAGNWAVDERLLNPSYLNFYAYPYFHAVDPEGGWLRVRDAGYRLIRRIMTSSQFRLPPDFLYLDEAGALKPVETHGRFDSYFSFDAVRVYWRIAMDCLLNGTPAACADPAQTPRMAGLFARDGKLYACYNQRGEPCSKVESPSLYGALLPAFKFKAPPLARELLARQLSAHRVLRFLGDNDRYYDANWVWFGLAAAGGLLTERTPPPNKIVLPAS